MKRLPVQWWITLIAGVCLLATTFGCSSFDPLRGLIGPYRNYVEHNGTVKNMVFSDPCGRFTMLLPRDLCYPGIVISGKLLPQGGEVRFMDDNGTLIRLDVTTAITHEEKTWLRSAEKNSETSIFENNRALMQQVYRQAISESTMVHQEYVRGQDGMTLDYFVFELPGDGGTSITGNPQKIIHTRLDAFRASVAFHKAGTNSVFTLSVRQPLDRIGDKRTREKTIASLKRWLVEDLYHTITITDKANEGCAS